MQNGIIPWKYHLRRDRLSRDGFRADLLPCPVHLHAGCFLSGTKPLINGEVFLWPKDFTLDSYKQIFTYPNFFKAYGNTFLYAVGGTAIALIMTSLMAYPLSKTFLWGNKFFTKMVVVTMFFSGGLIPNYLLLNSLHLVGTRAAMLMPFAINSFNLIILINFSGAFPMRSRRRR